MTFGPYHSLLTYGRLRLTRDRRVVVRYGSDDLELGRVDRTRTTYGMGDRPRLRWAAVITWRTANAGVPEGVCIGYADTASEAAYMVQTEARKREAAGER